MRTGLMITLLLVATAHAQPVASPNLVIVFVDDLGYGDLDAHATPHVDRMAAEGRRFTDFYVAQPVCSASRAALLTGCYPNRVGISGALGPGSRRGLHDDETTLSELLKEAGYATAVFGKWHLGHHAPFLPGRHGFDEFYGIPYSNDMWPLHPDYSALPPGAAKRKRGYPDLPIFEDDHIVDPEVTPGDQSFFTRDFTRRTVDFIDRHHDGPFFVYLAHPMPHVPLFVSDDFDGRSGSGLYGDVVAEIDWSVGQVLAALDRHGIAERTLVIFASDNGPWLSYGDHAGTAGPLREGKGTTFEGGVRVPCVMRWPGTIPAGSTCREPMMTIDVLPTVASLVGAGAPPAIDGRDATSLLTGRPRATSPQEAYFFYYHDNHLEAMRSGRWKLHLPHGYRSMEGREPGRGGTPGKYDHDRRTGLELYDLEADVGERRDVADQHPEVVARLMALVESMRADLGDALTEREPTGRRPPGRLEAPTGDRSDAVILRRMLRFEGVRKSLGGHEIIRGIDLEVEAGRTTVLIGPSGCGKSTLLRLLVRLLVPDAGRVVYAGKPVDDSTVLGIRHRTGYVIQDGGLFPHLTARGNVTLMGRELGWERSRLDARLDALRALTKFPADGLDRYPRQLSGGQQQRVALMRALLLDPDVLLLDEPLAALDPMIRFDLQTDLRAIFRELGKTTVLVTHDLAEAAYFADHVVLLRDGAVVQQGTIRELLERPEEPFVERFVRAQRSHLDGLEVDEP